MKTVRVVAAVIERGGEVLATQRGYGAYEGWWEFPGGKIEPGETPEQALVREIREELRAEIEIERHIVDVSYDYPEFHLEMKCFLCRLAGGEVTLVEHEAAAWLDAENVESVKWLPSDVEVVDTLREQGVI